MATTATTATGNGWTTTSADRPEPIEWAGAFGAFARWPSTEGVGGRQYVWVYRQWGDPLDPPESGVRRSLSVVVGAGFADFFYLGHGFAEVGQPGFAVLGDELDAPAEGVAAGAGHAGVDEGVEDLAFGLAEAGHHRCGQ